MFVKHALDELAAEWLRSESRIYTRVTAPFLPVFVAFHDAEQSFLVIDDLSDAYWPPPWRRGQIALGLQALDEVHATPPPEGIPDL